MAASPTKLSLQGFRPGDVHDPVADAIYVNPALGAFNEGLFLNLRPWYESRKTDSSENSGGSTAVAGGSYLNGLYSVTSHLGLIAHATSTYRYAYNRSQTASTNHVYRRNEIGAAMGGGAWARFGDFAVGAAGFASWIDVLDETETVFITQKLLPGIALNNGDWLFAYSAEIFENYEVWQENTNLVRSGDVLPTARYLPTLVISEPPGGA